VRLPLFHVSTENKYRAALSGIAMQHADDGYFRRVNFGDALVRNMVLMYSADGTKVYGSRGEVFEGTGSL